MLLPTLLETAVLVTALLADGVQGRSKLSDKISKRNNRQAPRHLAPAKSVNSSTDGYRYYNQNTSSYLIESLPLFNFDLGEIYSGLVPIDKDNDSRALFFVYEPTVGPPVDEITVWFNGGPGCSSLEGFFQENGRFIWQPGTYEPYINEYSWVNLTNMFWVEFPVGVGFSIGDVTATNQVETAADFVNFFRNFQELFGISNYKIYVTGESYAGRYVPYVSAAMLDQNDTTHFDVAGALAYDPCIGQFDSVQEEVVAVPLVQANANLFNLNASTMADLAFRYEYCGYNNYTNTFLRFPPFAQQPVYTLNYSDPAVQYCDVFDLINNAAFAPNPCFDIYEINSMCPILFDPLAFPTELVYGPPDFEVYFNRTDVKMAIHAPLDVNWAECASEPVFIGVGGPQNEGDTSPNPIEGVLPQVIEATNRVLISNGDFDMIIITNGTLMAIQNMTWNGQMGFQTAPSTPINITLPDLQYAAAFAANGLAGVDGPQGIMGISHFERGLMWAETFQSGHMQPQYQPRVTYRHLQWVLGRIDAL